MRSPVIAVSFLLLAACEVPTPMAPAEPIGTFPTWGADFATPTQQPRSLMGAGLGGAPSDAPVAAAANGVPSGPMPGAIKSFDGGDPVLGKGIYQALCLRCHGENGEGGAMPGVGAVPALKDPDWQARFTDAQMARSIALGKGAMPSFMQDLDRDKLAAVIAHIRTLK
jgi:mono/diheme cytochrome c family protein